MSNPRTGRMYDPEAVKMSGQMTREAYKTVKHMDKVQLTAYIGKVWSDGYQAGLTAAKGNPGTGNAPENETK